MKTAKLSDIKKFVASINLQGNWDGMDIAPTYEFDGNSYVPEWAVAEVRQNRISAEQLVPQEYAEYRRIKESDMFGDAEEKAFASLTIDYDLAKETFMVMSLLKQGYSIVQ